MSTKSGTGNRRLPKLNCLCAKNVKINEIPCNIALFVIHFHLWQEWNQNCSSMHGAIGTRRNVKLIFEEIIRVKCWKLKQQQQPTEMSRKTQLSTNHCSFSLEAYLVGSSNGMDSSFVSGMNCDGDYVSADAHFSISTKYCIK